MGDTSEAKRLHEIIDSHDLSEIMVNNDNLRKGVSLANRAVEEDKVGNEDTATSLYERAAVLFLQAVQTETNPAIREVVLKMVDEYMAMTNKLQKKERCSMRVYNSMVQIETEIKKNITKPKISRPKSIQEAVYLESLEKLPESGSPDYEKAIDPRLSQLCGEQRKQKARFSLEVINRGFPPEKTNQPQPYLFAVQEIIEEDEEEEEEEEVEEEEEEDEVLQLEEKIHQIEEEEDDREAIEEEEEDDDGEEELRPTSALELREKVLKEKLMWLIESSPRDSTSTPGDESPEQSETRERRKPDFSSHSTSELPPVTVSHRHTSDSLIRTQTPPLSSYTPEVDSKKSHKQEFIEPDPTEKRREKKEEGLLNKFEKIVKLSRTTSATDNKSRLISKIGVSTSFDKKTS